MCLETLTMLNSVHLMIICFILHSSIAQLHHLHDEPISHDQPSLSFPALTDPPSLRRENVTIMAYNVNHLHYVFQITYRPRNEGPRIERLNEALRNLGQIPAVSHFGSPDVLVLTEVMSNRADSKLNGLIDVYPYITPRLGDKCGEDAFTTMNGCRDILFNGGVKILSKLPILRSDGLVFHNRMNGDKLVNKGALRVKVGSKSGGIFHVVGTHMQSTASSLQKTAVEEKQVRRLQIGEILEWLQTLEIPSNETVFLAGDFNVEFDSPEYQELLASYPSLNIRYHKNETVGGSFSAKYRGDDTNWLTAYHLYGSNVSQTDETLDFIAAIGDYKLPVSSSEMEVVPIKSDDPWSWWRMKGKWVIDGLVFYHSGFYRDLSDHYPVMQRFELSFEEQ